MAMKAVDEALEKLSDYMDNVNRPVSEGGLLEEGWDKVACTLVQANGITILNMCPIRFEGKEMIMGAPIMNLPLKEFVKQQIAQNGI